MGCQWQTFNLLIHHGLDPIEPGIAKKAAKQINFLISSTTKIVYFHKNYTPREFGPEIDISMHISKFPEFSPHKYLQRLFVMIPFVHDFDSTGKISLRASTFPNTRVFTWKNIFSRYLDLRFSFSISISIFRLQFKRSRFFLFICMQFLISTLSDDSSAFDLKRKE